MVKRKGKWYTSGSGRIWSGPGEQLKETVRPLEERREMETFTVIWNVIAEAAGFWMDHLIFINILLSIVIVFFERRDPKTVWTRLLDGSSDFY